MTLWQFIIERFRKCPEGRQRYFGLLFFIFIVCYVAPMLLVDNKEGVLGLDYYGACEAGSLLVSIVSCFFYYFSFKSFHYKGNFIFFLTWFYSLFYHVVGFIFIFRHDSLGTVISIFSITLAYSIIDHYVGQEHPEKDQQDEYEMSFILADIPAFIGLAFLLMATLIHSEDANWPVFISGASALQLILCNATFFIIQLGLHQYTPSLRRQ